MADLNISTSTSPVPALQESERTIKQTLDQPGFEAELQEAAFMGLGQISPQPSNQLLNPISTDSSNSLNQPNPSRLDSSSAEKILSKLTEEKGRSVLKSGPQAAEILLKQEPAQAQVSKPSQFSDFSQLQKLFEPEGSNKDSRFQAQIQAGQKQGMPSRGLEGKQSSQQVNPLDLSELLTQDAQPAFSGFSAHPSSVQLPQDLTGKNPSGLGGLSSQSQLGQPAHLDAGPSVAFLSPETSEIRPKEKRSLVRGTQSESGLDYLQSRGLGEKTIASTSRLHLSENLQTSGLAHPTLSGDKRAASGMVLEEGLKGSKKTLQGGASALDGLALSSQQPTPSQPMLASVVTTPDNRQKLSDESTQAMSSSIRDIRFAQSSGASRDGGGEIRLFLRPAQLGEVRLQVTTQGDRVGLKIQASDEKAKKIIEDSLLQLKDDLSVHQLVLNHVEVTVSPQSHLAFNSGQEWMMNREQSAQSHQQHQGNSQHSDHSRSHSGDSDGSGTHLKARSTMLPGHSRSAGSGRIDIHA